jgi:hypothetical protein
LRFAVTKRQQQIVATDAKPIDSGRAERSLAFLPLGRGTPTLIKSSRSSLLLVIDNNSSLLTA